MVLEDFAKTYGMYDYYCMANGLTYKLSEAVQCKDDETKLSVPVTDGTTVVEYVIMDKVI